MKKLTIISATFLACLFFYGCKKQDDAITPDSQRVTTSSTTIPLYVTSIGQGALKVGIKLALGNSGISKIYEFDTGSEVFFAGYQPGINWWPAASITPLNGSQKAPMRYGSTTEFNFQLVKSNVLFEGGLSINANMGQILSADKPDAPFQFTQSDWVSRVQADQPQLYNRFYGIFGAGLFSGNGSIWNGTELAATPLGQFTDEKSDGFIVRLNSSFNSVDNTPQTPTNQLTPNGLLEIGLTDDQRNQFPIQLPMIPLQNSLVSGFPNGDSFYAEHTIAGRIRVTDQFGNTTRIPVYILFDSGATSIGLTTNYGDLNNSPLAPFINNGKLIEGTDVVISANGVSEDSGWEWEFPAGHNIPTNIVTVENKPSLSGGKIFLIVNQAAFFNNDVMFDLKNGILGLLPK